MWKYTVIVPKKYGMIVYRLKEILATKLYNFSHAQAILEEMENYKYCLIVQEDIKNTIKAIVLSYLVDNFIYFYKRDYILQNLKFNIENNKQFSFFLKALICFDYPIDKEFILQTIKDCNTIYLDSLFLFGIKRLKNKWNELSTLANENYFYINNEDSFIQLVKFLISNIDYRVNTVNVYLEDNKYKFFDQNNNYINDYLLDFPSDEESFLINSLISLCPQKIRLHFDTKKVDYFLYELFDERIEKC